MSTSVVAPLHTRRRLRQITRSACRVTTDRSWLTSRRLKRESRWTLDRKSQNCSSPATSTPETGSSSSRMSGASRSARANNTRWSSPPESRPRGLWSRWATPARSRLCRAILPGAAGGAEEDGAPLGGECEEVEHRDRHVRVQGKPLRHVPDAGGALAVLRRAAETDFSRVRHLAQDREEQGGLSRAVGADQGGDLPAPDVGVDPRKDLHPSLPDGQVADLERVEMFAHGHRADSASLSVERFRRIASS